MTPKQPQPQPTETPTKPMEAAKKANIVFQENMKRLREKVQLYDLAKKNLKGLKIEETITIDQYNSNYGIIDNTLANTVSFIANDCKGRRAYHFGFVPESNYQDGQLLRKPACNCSHNPISVLSKKQARAAAEKYLNNWNKACNEWIGKGHLLLEENNLFTDTQVKVVQTPNFIAQKLKPKDSNMPKKHIEVKRIK